jgi:(Z)-2-((N-methylformamido)methylene)-5-hydroxybutyrolactone dehydrogenase
LAIAGAIRMPERLEAGTGLGRHASGGRLPVALRRLRAGGLGRENGQEAIRAYMQTKSVWIDTAETIPIASWSDRPARRLPSDPLAH